MSFEGYEPARLQGATRAAFADFSPGGVALRIECNYSGAAGTVSKGRFKSEPGDNVQTLMGCGAEREAREEALFTFFRESPSVAKQADGKLVLRVGGKLLILQRPEQRRLAFMPQAQELEGEWRLIEVIRYSGGNGFAGIGLGEVPARIVFGSGKAGYSRCPQYDLGYDYTESGRLLKTSGPALPSSPVACDALAERRHGAPDMPDQWDALTALHASPSIEWAGTDEILISTETLGLLLSRAPCRSMEQSDDHSQTFEVDCASPR